MRITDKPLIVLNFYSRIHNFKDVIEAWKNQSVLDCPIIVVDNRPRDETYIQRFPDNQIHDIWRWTVNSGCPSHFYPALDYPQYKYTLFADDDLIPGPKAIEHLLECANSVDNQFATIGQMGRIFQLERESGQRYSGRSSIKRQIGKMVKTHLTCRAHLILTENLPHVLCFRNRLIREYPDGFRLSRVHDDFLMCISLQMMGLPSYLIRIKDDIGYGNYELIARDIDDRGALWKKGSHFNDRNRLVDIALDMGWKPLTD